MRALRGQCFPALPPECFSAAPADGLACIRTSPPAFDVPARMTNENDADRHRELQAAGMRVLFKRAHGREAASTAELALFLESLRGKFDLSMLTAQELEEARRR